MRTKGRPKVGRNWGSLSFMEETFLVRSDKWIRRAQPERLWYNGFQKVYLSLYPCKIPIMQSLSPNNLVLRTLIILSVTVFLPKKSRKFGLHFWKFCTQISVTLSNQSISTSKICISVLVSNIINIQKQNMINNFHVRVITGRQRNKRLLENVINSWTVTSSWESHVAL